MRSQDRERRHGIYRYRLRDFRCQALSKERNPAFGFTPRGEEFGFVFLISLSHEEWRSAEAPSSASTTVDLVVEELLDVFDGKEMFTVHRDDDGIPNLGDKNLD
jgi:hypothetical protein